MLAKDASTGDLWAGASFCRNSDGSCKARWLKKDPAGWSTVGSSEVVDHAMIGLVSRFTARGDQVTETVFDAENLKSTANQLDRAGNLYLTLQYQGMLTITPPNSSPFSTAETSTNQSMLIKLNPAGDVVWFQPLTGDANVIAAGIAINPLTSGENYVAVSGWFKGQMHEDLGAEEAVGNGEDGFVTYFLESNESVAFERTVAFSAEGNNRITGVASHPDGSFWVTGWSETDLTAHQGGLTEALALEGDDSQGMAFAFVLSLSQGGQLKFGHRLYFGESKVRSAGVTALDRGGAMVWLYSDGGSQDRYMTQAVRFEADGQVSWRRSVMKNEFSFVRPVLPAQIGLRDTWLAFKPKSRRVGGAQAHSKRRRRAG